MMATSACTTPLKRHSSKALAALFVTVAVALIAATPAGAAQTGRHDYVLSSPRRSVLGLVRIDEPIRIRPAPSAVTPARRHLFALPLIASARPLAALCITRTDPLSTIRTISPPVLPRLTINRE